MDKRAIVGRVLLVALAAACMLLWRVWLPDEAADGSAFAAGAAALVLVIARLLRRSPLPPAWVPSLVAAPLAAVVAGAALAARVLTEAAVAAAVEDVARLACVGLVLAAEGLLTSIAGPANGRRAPALVALVCAAGELVAHHSVVREGGLALAPAGYTALAAAVTVVALVRSARRAAREDRGIPTSPLLTLVAVGVILWAGIDLLELTRITDGGELTPELVRSLATPMLPAVGAASVALVIALRAVVVAPTLAERLAALVLTAPFAVLPLFALAPEGGRDPMRSARELGVDPPTLSRSMRSWVGMTGTWDAGSLVLDVRTATTRALRRPKLDEPLREVPIPVSPPARSHPGFDEPVVVLASRSMRFDHFVEGLRVLGGRRHGLWLAVAPVGWQWLRGWRGVVARSAPAYALAVEAGDGAPDDYVDQMDVDGPAIGLVVRGAVATCVRLEAKAVAGHVQWVVHRSCGIVPLDDASSADRHELLRETEARHVLYAPEPSASLQSVVDVLARLSEEMTAVLMERWERACPPPARCEPHVSWETGSPRVWLTADRSALVERSP